MMKKPNKVFVIIPSLSADSPVKGAIALANSLAKNFPVTLIALKAPSISSNLISDDVEVIELNDIKFFFKRFLFIRKLYNNCKKDHSIVSISFCFSADLVNSFFSGRYRTFLSVRGNFSEVYPRTYGWKGRVISFLHFQLLKRMTCIISMTQSMRSMIKEKVGCDSIVVGNFIDELPLEKFRRRKPNVGDYKYIFVGSLIKGKNPDSLIYAAKILADRGLGFHIDFVGDGGLRSNLEDLVKKFNLSNQIKFHGFVEEPFSLISEADVFVLPSLSEGVSRAALEALYLGVPGIMRDVDGNAELIKKGYNGELFSSVKEMADVLIRTAELSRREDTFRKVLVPHAFRQNTAVSEYIKLI